MKKVDMTKKCYNLLNSRIELLTFDHRVKAIYDDPYFTSTEKFASISDLYSDTKAFDNVSSSEADLLDAYMENEIKLQYELTKK